MASLNEVYIKTETLEKVLKTLKKKGEKGAKFTIGMIQFILTIISENWDCALQDLHI